jgi:hypothetical protein
MVIGGWERDEQPLGTLGTSGKPVGGHPQTAGHAVRALGEPNQQRADMRRSRTRLVITGVAVLGALIAVVLVSRQPPQAVRDLVALAPPGSSVSLHRIEPDRSGWGSGPLGGWDWTFTTGDPTAALETYRAWFVARGYTVQLERASDGGLRRVVVEFRVSVERRDDGMILGSVGDDALGPGGNLRSPFVMPIGP